MSKHKSYEKQIGLQRQKQKHEAQKNKLANLRQYAIKTGRLNTYAWFNPHRFLKNYKQYVIRPIETWVPESLEASVPVLIQSLVGHCLYIYPVPKFLADVWSKGSYSNTISGRITLPEEDLRLWYICITQGRSIYKEHLQKYLTRAETHELLNCPLSGITAFNAMWYAVVKAAGLSETEAKRFLSRSEFHRYPVVSPFWRSVARFMCKLPTAYREPISRGVLDYLAHQHNRDPNFSLSGRTYNSIWKASREWHRNILTVNHNNDNKCLTSWKGVDRADAEYPELEDGIGDSWKFIQIKNNKDLYEEGQIMRHCVYTYLRECVTSECSIWSLRHIIGEKENHIVTIEVRDDFIVQIKGPYNFGPTDKVLEVIKKWAKDSELRFSLGGRTRRFEQQNPAMGRLLREELFMAYQRTFLRWTEQYINGQLMLLDSNTGKTIFNIDSTYRPASEEQSQSRLHRPNTADVRIIRYDSVPQRYLP